MPINWVLDGNRAIMGPVSLSDPRPWQALAVWGAANPDLMVEGGEVLISSLLEKGP